MTEKQQKLLGLFKEIDSICKKHSLRYVMAGGTLLGVVRNEGFLPWDDDIDIYMPREDWEKFVKLSETEFSPNRAVQCVDVDRSYTNSFPRYAATDSCVIHKHQVIGQDKAGEIVDVLTLDPIPKDDREYEKYRTHLMVYSDLINLSVVYGNRWEVSPFLYLKYLLQSVFMGKEKTQKKLEKILFSYKEEDCERCAMRWGGSPFLFDYDMMFPVKYGTFEGIEVMVPNRISDYLVWHYGDEWSYIPPHGERESHDAICVEGIAYQEFRKDYIDKVNSKKAFFNAAIRKFYYMATAKKSHSLKKECDEYLAEGIVLDLRTRIRECEKSLGQMLKEHDFHSLNEIFCNYFQVQLSAEFIGREDFSNIYPFHHPILIKLEDEIFQAAMLTLFYTERISKAYRMIQVREKNGYITPEMKKIQEDILQFRKAAACYEAGKTAEAETICDGLMRIYEKNPSFWKFKCRFIMDSLGNEADMTRGEEFLAKALDLFQEDGYFIKYKADILWKKGQEGEALFLYAEARKKTNNGIVQLEMDKFLNAQKETALRQALSLISDKKGYEASELMKLWTELLPDDERMHECMCLARAFAADKQEEAEIIANEIMEGFADEEKGERRRNCSLEDSLYKQALVQIWEFLGYPEALAEMRVALACAENGLEAENFAAGLRQYQKDNGCTAESYKLLGDIYRKCGKTKAAYVNYKKAVYMNPGAFVKTELTRIFLGDLYRGGKRASVYAKRADVNEFLDAWLEKYGDIQEMKELVHRLLA